MTTWLDTIVVGLVALLMGLGLGMGLGLHHATVQQAKVVQQQAQVRQVQQVQSALAAVKTENKATQAQTTIQTRTQVVTKEITQYVPKAVYVHDAPVNQPAAPPTVAQCVDRLSAAGVSLLNSQAAGRDPDPAFLASGPARTLTDIDLQALSQHDSAIAGQYNALAVRYNALIDLIRRGAAQGQVTIEDNNAKTN